MRPIACPDAHAGKDSDAALLLRLVGSRTFAFLQRAFGGRRVWIPKQGARLACKTCRLRDECIRLWRRQGHSASEIARYLRISPKTVYRVLK